jgi:hypothetical protein
LGPLGKIFDVRAGCFKNFEEGKHKDLTQKEEESAHVLLCALAAVITETVIEIRRDGLNSQKSPSQRSRGHFLIANFAPQAEHLPSAVTFGCCGTSAPHSPHFTIISPP